MQLRVLVTVKRVIDYNVKAKVKADGTGVDLANVKMSMNPFDEIAVEEALRLKEAGIASEVVIVSIGEQKSVETVRTTLAMGTDRGLLVIDDQGAEIEPLSVAKILAKIVDEEAPDEVILGKQAIDNDMNATGQMLAVPLGWGQATFASKFKTKDRKAVVRRGTWRGVRTGGINPKFVAIRRKHVTMEGMITGQREAHAKSCLTRRITSSTPRNRLRCPGPSHICYEARRVPNRTKTQSCK